MTVREFTESDEPSLVNAGDFSIGLLMTDNPYTSPTEDNHDVSLRSPPRTELTLAAIAKPTFLAWERLRVVYVAVLGLVTILLVGKNVLQIRTIVTVVEGAIVANICFFAGPIVETYVRWLGYDKKWVRWFLFLGGTALTVLLATAALASMFLPNQN